MGAGAHPGQGGFNDRGGTGDAGNPDLPPLSTLSSSGQPGQPHPGSGGGHAMTGKVESAIGGVIGSKSLKAKGLQKEQ